MSDKIEFPLGVELPLRGGGVAVLYEFHAGKWYGRMKLNDEWGWEGANWYADGDFDRADPSTIYDLAPLKRKAWVVWYPDSKPGETACEIVWGASYASMRAKELGGTYQEITEP